MINVDGELIVTLFDRDKCRVVQVSGDGLAGFSQNGRYWYRQFMHERDPHVWVLPQSMPQPLMPQPGYPMVTLDSNAFEVLEFVFSSDVGSLQSPKRFIGRYFGTSVSVGPRPLGGRVFYSPDGSQVTFEDYLLSMYPL